MEKFEKYCKDRCNFNTYIHDSKNMTKNLYFFHLLHHSLTISFTLYFYRSQFLGCYTIFIHFHISTFRVEQKLPSEHTMSTPRALPENINLPFTKPSYLPFTLLYYTFYLFFNLRCSSPIPYPSTSTFCV